MKYLFILGQNPTLSLAEIHAKFPEAELLKASPRVALFKFTKNKSLNPDTINLMGGTVKIAKLIEGSKEKNKIETSIATFLEADENLKRFGLSFYTYEYFDSKKMGLKIKSSLPKKLRFVFNNSPILSSESVRKNKLFTEIGAEIIVTTIDNQFYVARTIACQNPRSYKSRDDLRPYRDTRLGMIPPRLAQIMLNIADCAPTDTLIDPFCGLGTIVQEGYLMGKKIVGTDADQYNINKAKKNLKYIQERFVVNKAIPKLLKSNAKHLRTNLPQDKFRVVVTEGYLGPVTPNPKNYNSIWGNLFKLYQQCFFEFRKILRDKGKIVITLPVFFDNQNKPILVPFFDKLLELGYTQQELIPEQWADLNSVQLANRGTIVYRRPSQIVGREICLLQVKPPKF